MGTAHARHEQALEADGLAQVAEVQQQLGAVAEILAVSCAAPGGGAAAHPRPRRVLRADGQHSDQRRQTVRDVATQHVLADGQDRSGHILVVPRLSTEHRLQCDGSGVHSRARIPQ